eukprot:TRINITY_DN4473_c0_g1_i1.p1 TRINITY_DN4473_c0_g1~~TRINITY_DN4473_c0_g1_i1.p1  ORF type:complete len:347 (+),score=53.75 TRINITY_DN4473_c0_g1_i1:38-1078(+)
MGPIRKALVGEEPLIAADALETELKEVLKKYPNYQVTPGWIPGAIRKGEKLPIINEPVGLVVELETPAHRLGDDVRIGCQMLFHIPVGYPIVPPVEQGEGDIVVNMTGSISKQSMRDLGRDIHIKVIQQYESSCGTLPSYILQILSWASSTDLTESVSSKVIPRSLSSPQSCRKFIRLHHIESHIKTAYGLLWGTDHSVTGFIARGQPAMVMVEGATEEVEAWTEKFTNVLHWGPIPAQVLLTRVCEGGEMLKGFKVVSDLFPSCVTRNGAFNGRDSVNYRKLQSLLPPETASHLGIVLPAMAHDGGHVDAEEIEESIKEILDIPQPKDPQPDDKKKKKKKKSRLQ